MSRFVILKHTFLPLDDALANPLDHYDLMLEIGPALATWRSPQLPEMGTITDWVRLPDHRLAYLDYEGPISGDRGHVRRVDRGDCKVLIADDHQVVADVNGTILQGRIVANRIISSLPNCDDYWSVALRTMDAIRNMGPRGEKT